LIDDSHPIKNDQLSEQRIASIVVEHVYSSYSLKQIEGVVLTNRSDQKHRAEEMNANENQSDRDAHKELIFCRRMSTADPPKYLLGIERNRSEMRQLGGLLVILGIGAANSALALTAAIVEGGCGTMQIDGVKLPALIATLIQVAMGMIAMAVGFITLVATPISKVAHRVDFSRLSTWDRFRSLLQSFG
jgi:hypothetical protein